MALPPAPPAAPHSAPPPPANGGTGLLLTGGGARAAYQVGVLQGIAAIRRECGAGQGGNPFPIITGTSAGAINAAALACGADHFDTAVRRLARIWRGFQVDQVYHADALAALRAGTRWLALLSAGWALARWRRAAPRSLLDNAPLADLLREHIALHRLPALRQAGHVQALAVTASSYATGEHMTFYEAARTMRPWTRAQRRAVRTPIAVEHLLASSAIPFLFPAAAVTVAGRTSWYGDGSMRQIAPIAPAIHLGAQRILVVGAGRAHETDEPSPHTAREHGAYPTLAQMAGHALSSIFLDALSADIERMQRVNRTLALLTPAQRTHSALRPIELLVIAPSQRLDALATQHVAELPRPVHALLAMLGASGQPEDTRSATLASYLLFERGYTQALMELGRADALRQRAEVRRFFGWGDAAPACAAAPAPARPQRR